ncbi:hypothetical protein P7H21_23865 [Paenibacillus larvae]|nr:hypothetical protein [Paenibacillus larvae]MDT2306380.1 hypothetical protein [Paenibacillus larvae]
MNEKTKKPNSKFKVGDFAMLQGGQKIVEIVSKTFFRKNMESGDMTSAT